MEHFCLVHIGCPMYPSNYYYFPNSFQICEGASVKYTKEVCNLKKYFKFTGLNQSLFKVNAFNNCTGQRTSFFHVVQILMVLRGWSAN